MSYIMKVIEAGNLLELEIYKPLRKVGIKGITKKANYKQTTEQQQKLNQINSKKHCYRLINANFRAGEDLYITLDHKANLTVAQAFLELKNYIRRLNYYRKKEHRPNIKYIGRTEQAGRCHSHVIIEYIPKEVLKKLWKQGGIKIKTLYQAGNFHELANYLTKEECTGKRWTQSLYLKQPKITRMYIRSNVVEKLRTGQKIISLKRYQEIYKELTFNQITGTVLYFQYTKLNC